MQGFFVPNIKISCIYLDRDRSKIKTRFHNAHIYLPMQTDSMFVLAVKSVEKVNVQLQYKSH